MSGGVISVSIRAIPLQRAATSEEMLLMGPGLYLHITPEIARQWIGVLEEIAKESRDGTANT